uniref:MHC class II beta chain N-terminal domain-containing protein n=1 Tax=Naja naja TaxID=35670 RepID=A0A8C6X234_NAJNA
MGPGVPPNGLSPPPPPSLAAHFLYQRVRFLERYFYDRQEFARFDSDLGKFVAVTALGKVDADGWNRDEQLLQYEKAGVDRLWIPFGYT